MTQIAQPAAFLDRDGTLVEEVNYLSRVEDLRIFPFTAGALRLLKQMGFLTIVVTNQSGIGRGIYTEQAMQSIHTAMAEELGDLIDDFYFCPHLPDAGCRCRKPGTGMIEAAEKRFAIDRGRSYMIGDKRLDIETGFNAGTRSALVKTGYGLKTVGEIDRQPDVIAENLLAVVEQILSAASADAV
jgi:D-glycero-D-manno-heptose 1,7-bisphosphate phosphatase